MTSCRRIHIYHEDSTLSSTTQFWRGITNLLIPNNTIEIKGFNGNEELCKYLANISINNHDIYIIFMDKVVDNQKALSQYKKARRLTDKYKNVYISNLLSFEYLILTFKYLQEWTEPIQFNRQYRDALVARKCLINAVNNKITWISDANLINYISQYKGISLNSNTLYIQLSHISYENLATDILSRIVNGGKNDFSLSKTHFGNCWLCNCCTRHSKVSGPKKCRLYGYSKTSKEKATNLWNCTQAKLLIRKALKYFEENLNIQIHTDFDSIL